MASSLLSCGTSCTLTATRNLVRSTTTSSSAGGCSRTTAGPALSRHSHTLSSHGPCSASMSASSPLAASSAASVAGTTAPCRIQHARATQQLSAFMSSLSSSPVTQMTPQVSLSSSAAGSLWNSTLRMSHVGTNYTAAVATAESSRLFNTGAETVSQDSLGGWGAGRVAGLLAAAATAGSFVLGDANSGRALTEGSTEFETKTGSSEEDSGSLTTAGMSSPSPSSTTTALRTHDNGGCSTFYCQGPGEDWYEKKRLLATSAGYGAQEEDAVVSRVKHAIEFAAPPGWVGARRRITEKPKPAFPKSYEVSVRALKGGRLSMEDEYFVGNNGRFAAVYDGHGGGGVSSFLRDQLYDTVDQYLNDPMLEENAGDVSRNGGSVRPSISSLVGALRSAFNEMEEKVMADDSLKYQGSTAVAVAVHEGDDGHRTLLSANVGDSRAILSRRGRAVDLTRDHKPNDEREKARILAMGEAVEWDHYCKVHRVRNLSLSRAIGDRFAKPAVSGEVEIKRFPVAEDGDEFMLLASDGVWDVMTSQEAVSFVHKKLKAPSAKAGEDMERTQSSRRRNMSRYIANEALRRGSADNVCVVIVWLKDLDMTP